MATIVKSSEPGAQIADLVQRALGGEEIIIAGAGSTGVKLEPCKTTQEPDAPKEFRFGIAKGQAHTLTLDRELDAYLGYLIGFWNLDILPVTNEHALAVRELPHHHRDPFDRMLVAQARTVGLTIVTNDPQIGRYDVAVAW